MTTSNAKTVRLLYGILLSIAAVAAGICLMAGCLQIYNSGGEQLYTPDKVAETFRGIAVPVYVFLALCILSIPMELLLPPAPKSKAAPVPGMVLQRLREKADMLYCGPQLKAAIEKQRKSRMLHTGIALGLLAVGSTVFLCYALNGDHFHKTDINASMLRAMYWLLGCLAIPFGYSLFAAYYSKKSILREIELIKTVPKAAAGTDAPVKKDLLAYIRWGFLAVAIFLLVFGFFTGGWQDVLTKAVNICTECVGLG